MFVDRNQAIAAAFAAAGIEHLEYSAQDLEEMADMVTDLDTNDQTGVEWQIVDLPKMKFSRIPRALRRAGCRPASFAEFLTFAKENRTAEVVEGGIYSVGTRINGNINPKSIEIPCLDCVDLGGPGDPHIVRSLTWLGVKNPYTSKAAIKVLGIKNR